MSTAKSAGPGVVNAGTHQHGNAVRGFQPVLVNYVGYRCGEDMASLARLIFAPLNDITGNCTCLCSWAETQRLNEIRVRISINRQHRQAAATDDPRERRANSGFAGTAFAADGNLHDSSPEGTLEKLSKRGVHYVSFDFELSYPPKHLMQSAFLLKLRFAPGESRKKLGLTLRVAQMKFLVAGVGNILRGDDGFGVAVAQNLMEARRLQGDVTVFESGIAGIALVQELMSGFDVLIIVDAIERDGPPGTLYLLEPEVAETEERSRIALHQSLADAHYSDPAKVLTLAKALGVLPSRVFLLGCEPGGYDELGADLSPPVRRAVEIATSRIESLVSDLRSEEQRGDIA